MVVDIKLNDSSERIGDIVDYSVQEDATSLTIGDSAGSVGQIRVTARAKLTGPVAKRSGGSVGDEVSLSNRADDQKGDSSRIRGTVTQAAMPGERITLSAETLLARFNAERTAKPFYGVYQPPTSTITYRTNYSSNPSREVDLTNIAVNLAAGVGAASLTRPLTGGAFEGAFARVTWTTADAAGDGGMYDIIPDIAPNASYTFSGYYRANRVDPAILPGMDAQRVRLIIRFYNSSGVATGGDTNVPIVLKQGEWTRISGSAVAPAAAASARLYCVGTTGTGWSNWKVGDSLDSDGILVERSGLGPFFDGGSAPPMETMSATDSFTMRTYAWAGTPGKSQSVETTIVTQLSGTGYDATVGSYFRYLCELVGISATSVDSKFENIPVTYPGWTGNVWKYVKDFAAANRAEVALVDDTVVLRTPRTRTIPLEGIAGPTVSVDSTLTSQFIQVNNYNATWGVDQNAFSATSVYQVESGGTTVAEVSIPHFLDAVNNPIATNKMNVLDTTGSGQYTVVDSQGLVVDSAWWNSNGGSVKVERKQDDPNGLRIIITGARFSPEAYVGPFRIGRDAGGIVPALTITGTGVFTNKVTHRIRTGVSPSQTSTIDASVIDNVFLTNADLAYTRGLDAACLAAGPTVRLSGVIRYDLKGQEFGITAGSRVKYADNVFRIVNATYSSQGISFSAVADMTFADLTDLYSYTFAEFNQDNAGRTFADLNALLAGKTFTEYNAQTSNTTFAQFNAIYEAATFKDHATFPNVSEIINE